MHILLTLTQPSGKTLITNYMIQTSLSANRYMEESGRKQSHKDKILLAFRHVKSGTFESIAQYAGLSAQQCWKRLSELESDGLIHKTSQTKILSSGDRGVVWAITEQVLIGQQDLFAA